MFLRGCHGFIEPVQVEGIKESEQESLLQHHPRGCCLVSIPRAGGR